MNRTTRLGMLTPSSNTALEPLTAAMLTDLPDVTAHFSRLKVTEIALSETSLRQFDDSEILRAAELLAHAKVDVIAWNGTSASWLGLERDERLCERIVAATGIQARTTVLAFRDIFQQLNAERIGLVTPYRKDVQQAIITKWGLAGMPCVTERHLGLQDNFSFAEVEEEVVAGMIREVAREGCEAVAVVCTNMRGAGVVQRLEQELDVPIYDSIAVTLWTCLRAVGVDPARVRGWGGLFRDQEPVTQVPTTEMSS